MTDNNAQTFASPGATEAITHVRGAFDHTVNAQDERVSLYPAGPQDALKALLATPPGDDATK